MSKTYKPNGFSLIELLIVVAIILIISAIAIPNLMRSRMAANEASAVGSLRTINSAEISYQTTYPSVGFTGLSALGGAGGTSTGAGLLDSVLAAGTKSGYSFAVTTSGSSPITGYSVTGQPSTPGITGQRYFFTDHSGVIRQNPSAAATVSSTPL
ncbi:MAG TPA: prepilin-type N-terminal cleavage/methylation domain-containing protein [Terriglobales bacterium]|nr:prepilin-type N-terminal cleavage/methylation domain-containing protein [Terriglobales bacterium]